MSRYIETPDRRSRPRTAPHPPWLRGEPGPIGVHANPADCEHPVEARVTPGIPGYEARCADCGSHRERRGEWVVLRWTVQR